VPLAPQVLWKADQLEKREAARAAAEAAAAKTERQALKKKKRKAKKVSDKRMGKIRSADHTTRPHGKVAGTRRKWPNGQRD
jgi:hypothetical protein